MGSEELAANLFRITQTEAKLKKDNIEGESEANKTHYNIGKKIREVIAKNGGTMPEYLPKHTYKWQINNIINLLRREVLWDI